jgi:ribonuclease H / adenosylcobalamin/alpha-ribazole phosphatase
VSESPGSDGHYSAAVFGEARGNPGLAGTGAVIHDQTGREIRRLSEFLGVSTPVQAEYRAVLSGLMALTELAPNSATVLTSHEAPFRQLTGKSSAHIPEVMKLYVQSQTCMSQLPGLELRLVESSEVDIAERLAAIAIDSRGRRQAFD